MAVVIAGCLYFSCAKASNSNVSTDSTGFNKASNNTIRTDTARRAGVKGPTNDNNQNLSTNSSVDRSKGNNGANTTDGVNGTLRTRVTSDRGRK